MSIAPSAFVVADSVNLRGDRVTTMEVVMHRFVLAEFNTHRVFSRNSASSRAIPFRKQMKLMEERGLAYPISWPAERPGMSGGEELSPTEIFRIIPAWDSVARGSASVATALAQVGVHKSVINRLLEPFMWHKVIVSSTAYENFFDQRLSTSAQPEIRAAAEAMYVAREKSTPKELRDGEWHLPYIREDDIADTKLSPEELRMISAARCARVSYLTHDGERDTLEDIKLYSKLVNLKHWSPLEHVATPWQWNHQMDPIAFRENGKSFTIKTSHLPCVGNFPGWRQLRTTEEVHQDVRTFQ